MPSFVYKTFTIQWNVLNNVEINQGFTYGMHTQQLHLAKFVKQIFGSLKQLRSRNQYNVYYRAIGNELLNQSLTLNRALFDLFLRTASFDSLKAKWSVLFNFAYPSTYSEQQFRALLYGLNKAYRSRPSPGSIKRAIQTICQIDSNRIQVYEFWRDYAIMTFFTFDWLLRNDIVILATGTVTSATSNTLKSTVLSSYSSGSLTGFNAYITSGSDNGDVRPIVGNIQSTGVLTISGSWTITPSSSDSFSVILTKRERNSLNSLRPDLKYYTSFGLTNYGFQVWISVDNYLNAINFVSDIVKKIKQSYTVASIVYILHRTKSGSVTTALSIPSKNPTYVAIGSGKNSWDAFDPQPTGSETVLYNEIFRTIGLVNYLNPDESPSLIPTSYLEITGFFRPGQGTNSRVMEVGIFAQDGTTLLHYAAYVAINKQSIDPMIWKVRMQYDSL